MSVDIKINLSDLEGFLNALLDHVNAQLEIRTH